MSRLLVIPLLLVSVLASFGCDQRLTPDLVREYIENPTGKVDEKAMGHVAHSIFGAGKASSAEGFANLIKSDQGGGGSSNLSQVASFGVLDDARDVFCAAGIATEIATFDSCELGEDCETELTIDSCILRLGDEGADENARGKLHFLLKNTTEEDLDRSELRITFEGFETTHSDETVDNVTVDYIDGLIALETTQYQSEQESRDELIFTADIDDGVKEVESDRGWFDDGYITHDSVSVGLRFLAAETDTSTEGSIELLAFVDEDGGRDEAVVVRAAAESHQVDADSVVGSASISVEGTNGAFECHFDAAEDDNTPEGDKVSASGSCTDADGETFSFDATATDG